MAPTVRRNMKKIIVFLFVVLSFPLLANATFDGWNCL